MTKQIKVNISVPLYNLIIKEKKILKEEQKNKVRSRKVQITMITASQSLVRKLR